MKLKRKVPAYNLQELLVVLVIIGILILIAMPNFMGVINNAKSTEAKLNLKTIHSLQKNHRYMYNSYTLDVNKIDFIAPKTTKEGGTANYTYQIIEASGNSFKAQAIAINDGDGDGNKSTWEIDENGIPKEIIKD
ncbi:prepilin-type N-terminal cleavage/methylation domain-containing protein [Pseudotenacibaculum sp. MALMAid0570]|uniref:prepilin-type N-terminal cleavage/methylation domain-containing protein n=1 Tax=Pseudotenacibaculum sp. MALMAid0570 TaxID=3143938 RepID=UPI0032DEB8AB